MKSARQTTQSTDQRAGGGTPPGDQKNLMETAHPETISDTSPDNTPVGYVAGDVPPDGEDMQRGDAQDMEAGGIPSPFDDDIRQRAYEIWEEDGRPEGLHLTHWARAEQELRPAQIGERPYPDGLDSDEA